MANNEVSGWERLKSALEWLQHIDLVARWGGMAWIAFRGLLSILIGWVAKMIAAHHVSSDWLHLIEFGVGLLVFGFLLLFRKPKSKGSIVTPTPLPELTPKVEVELTPSSGPSQEIVLTVINKGKAATFHARCSLIALRNSPNELSRKSFNMKWEHTSQRAVHIARGDSSNLLVATAEMDHKKAFAQIRIVGLSEDNLKQYEWSGWTLQPKEKLPEYDMEIRVFSDQAEDPFIQQFTVRPKAWYGPLEILPLRSVTPHSVNDADPRVIVRIDPVERELGEMYTPTSRPLILNNRGGSDALAVQIEPLTSSPGQARFKEIPMLEPQKDFPIYPEILWPDGSEVGGVSKVDRDFHNIEVFLQAEWNSHSDIISDTIEMPFTITYKDYKDQRFRTDGLLVYCPHGGNIEAKEFKFTRL